MRRLLAAVVVLALLGAGVAFGLARRGGADDGPSLSRVASDRDCEEPAVGSPIAKVARASLALRELAQLDQPTWAIWRSDGSGNGLISQRGGEVLAVDAGAITGDVVLDLRGDTMQDGDGGLLALAYSADGDWLFAYRADARRDDVVTAYPVDGRGRPDQAQERVILSADHPDSLQHHGGALAIGTDGFLYVGFGDGGGLGDPRGNAQDPGTWLGKVLRIDPTPGAVDPYRIPPDNPFIDDPGSLPEIWLLGVRNPFRLGWDAETGDLWLGDVGQSCWEELDRLPTGADSAGGSNLGWDIVEGNHRFEGGVVPGRGLGPEQEHPHIDGWCGIVAGYVLRASPLPSLDGRLLYTDYCAGQILALAVDGTPDPTERVLDTRLRIQNPVAIVPGPAGAPWVLSLDGRVWEIAELPK